MQQGAHRGNSGIAVLTAKFDGSCGLVVNATSQPINPPEEEAWYPS